VKQPPMLQPSMLQSTTTKESRPASVSKQVAAHPMAQHYGTLLHTLRGRNLSTEQRSAIGVTSVQAGAGATTVAQNLGWRAAVEGTSTLVVDLDMNRRDLTRRLHGKRKTPGFLEFLHSEADLIDCLQETEDDQLHLLSCGKGSGLVAPDVAQHVMNELTTRFDLVIFDLPPVSEVGMWQAFGPHLDGVLLVLEAEREDQRAILDAKRQMSDAGIKITGAVWNKQRPR